MQENRLKAALFDLDGVVFDTEPQYTIFWGGECRRYHPEHPRLEHEIKGSTLQRDYTITKGSEVIGSAHKKLMSWGDSYEIEIEEHENETAVVAVILAINAILNDEKDEDINRFSDDD